MRAAHVVRCFLLLVLGGAGLTAGGPVVPTLDVAGVRVPVRGVATVGEALVRAHVQVGSGRYVAAVSGRTLPEDRTPVEVYVDGRPARIDSPVHAGDVITVLPGGNRREPLVARDLPVHANKGVAALYVGGRAGATRVVRGALSGETVSRRLVRRPVLGHLVAPGALGLTFDDGPDPRWTPRVLAVLARSRVRATFCVVGRHVDEHPELVRAIVAGGHVLCNHTYDHDELLARRTPQQRVAQIARTQAAVPRATGTAPRFFRAPGGNWTSAVEGAAKAQGLVPLKWTADPRDWTRPGAREIVTSLLPQLAAGRIVLLHDGGGDRSQTVTALTWLLARLPGRGFSFQLPVAPR